MFARQSALGLALLLALIVSTARADDRLSDMEPLIGSWACKTRTAEIESHFRWMIDGAFIEHDHVLHMFGRANRVKEVIGWDAASQSIRGWIFSDEGVSICTYVRDGDDWQVDLHLTRNDGTEDRKQKTLTIGDGRLIVRNEKAPLPEFLQLEFMRADGEPEE